MPELNVEVLREVAELLRSKLPLDEPNLVYRIGDYVNHTKYGRGVLFDIHAGYARVSFLDKPIATRTVQTKFLTPTYEEYQNPRDNLRGEVTELEKIVIYIKSIWMNLERNYMSPDSELDKYGNSEVFAEFIKIIRRYFVRQTLKEILNSEIQLDNDQLDAIAQVNVNLRLRARAGSGKTSTLVYKCIFMIKQCGLTPSSILILAFNRSAAEEVRKRIFKYLYPNFLDELTTEIRNRRAKSRNIQTLIQLENDAIKELIETKSLQFPEILTFHALAYRVCLPEGEILFDDKENEHFNQSFFIQNLINSKLEEIGFFSRIKSFLLRYLKQDWETLVLKILKDPSLGVSKEEQLAFRRALQFMTLDGRTVKSGGEKLIGDFLFEHGIDYQYERYLSWKGSPYKPDFTIETQNYKIIIEYFGMQGDEIYDKQTLAKKEFITDLDDVQLIDIYPEDLSNGEDSLKPLLTTRLEELGVIVTRLSSEEIWNRIERKALFRFTEMVRSFIGRARSLNKSFEQLSIESKGHIFLHEIEREFLDIALELLHSYEVSLETKGDTDFSGLLFKAVDLIREGRTRLVHKNGIYDLSTIKFLAIDEFQDFSEAFNSLIDIICKTYPQIDLFAVGDDWQAINGFAGSDLTYFNSFRENYQYLKHPISESTLRKNYRSDGHIVELANQLMIGKGIPAVSTLSKEQKVIIADMAHLSLERQESTVFGGDKITPALLRIIKTHSKMHKSITILSRTNQIPYFVNSTDYQRGDLNSYRDYLLQFLDDETEVKLKVRTAHDAKGQEDEVVILIDAISRRYPLIHPDWVLTRILGENLQRILDEERRLFYVALTRAKSRLFLVVEGNQTTEYLNPIRDARPELFMSFSWPEALSATGAQTGYFVKIEKHHSGLGGTYPIRELLKSCNYKFDNEGKFWHKKINPIDEILDLLKLEAWATCEDPRAENILVTISKVSSMVNDSMGNEKYAVSNNTWKKIS